MISWMNIHNPYIPIEYNRKVTDRLRINTSLGFILSKDGWAGGYTDSTKNMKKHNSRGLRLSIEPQFFFKSVERAADTGNFYNYYIGLDFNVTQYKYISERAISDISNLTRRYNVNSQCLGLNLLFGSHFMTDERAMMSSSAGFGIRYLNVKNDLDVPVSSLYGIYRLGEASEVEENGKHIRFTVSLNMRIAFWLK